MMKIVFLTKDPFPFGMASTRRIYLLAKSLAILEENSVVVLSIRVPPRQFNKSYIDWKGQIDKINYEYTTRTTNRSDFFFVRRIVELFGIINVLWILAIRKITKNIDCLYLWETIQHITVFRLIIVSWCFLFGIPIIQEMNEKTWREKYQANIFEKIISPLFGVNGVVCISNYLFEWAKKEALQNNLKTTAIKIPILIDVQESQINTLLNMHREDFFLFAGAPEYAKSILFIINAMKEVWVKYPNVKLKITGFDINDDRAFWLKKFLDNEDKLNKKIIVTGYLDRSELLNNYLQANALLMPLFDDLASKARFPTKLGEYLASGRPVIACKIGELKIYLTHKINALLVDPITIEEFSRQMVYVKERPEEAIQIGLKGRLIAEQFFDYPMYSNVLSKFFKSIR